MSLNLSKRMDTEKKEDKHENSLGRNKKYTKLQYPNFGVQKYVLHVMIHSIDGVDPPIVYPDVRRRHYRTNFWVNPDAKYKTSVRFGYPCVAWRDEFRIPLINVVALGSMFLSVEVISIHSGCDQESSSGIVVVGRAKVPLPDVPRTEVGKSTGLVRFVKGELVAQGRILTKMELLPWPVKIRGGKW